MDALIIALLDARIIWKRGSPLIELARLAVCAYRYR